MTILLTGCAGFVGMHLAEELLARGHHVLGTDRRACSPSLQTKGRFTDLECDLADRSAVFDLFQFGIRQVVHTAAVLPTSGTLSGTGANAYSPNLLMTQYLIEAARAHGVDQVVYSSSMSVYGTPRYLPVDEHHSQEASEPYGQSKLDGEAACARYAERMSVVILRYAGVFGEGRDAGAMFHFVRSARRGEAICLDGDGTQTHDFVDVKDVVAASVASLENCENQGVCTYNIGSGVERSLTSLVDVVKTVTRSTSPVRCSGRPAPYGRFVLDISKAQRELGYRPTPLEVSLERLVGNGYGN